ncbi:MAG: thioredoxin domain-containing protein [Pseudomonadota bacterium]
MTAKLAGIIAAFLAMSAPLAAQEREQNLSNPDSDFVDTTRKGNWQAVVEPTERGHLIGNPLADVKLIEFVSYTCGHCASFAAEGEPALDLVLLMPGEMTLEVRPVIRNPLDLTISMLVACGDVDQFKSRHRAFMFSQGQWLEKAREAPQGQQAIWARADANARLNMARSLDLDDMMAKRGQSVAEINACLMDDRAADAMIANGRADKAEFAVPGTPSFALDGSLLEGVHSWDALYEVLSARFKPNRSNDSAGN